jgi:hypothetical protein
VTVLLLVVLVVLVVLVLVVLVVLLLLTVADSDQQGMRSERVHGLEVVMVTSSDHG